MRETEASAYRFGSFELNPRAGELRKHGIRIKLQDQPLQILLLLLEHPGDVVTREEVQNRLWPPGTHVDYDNAINSAMRKLRNALGDASENPRFIETLARRGYRFIGHIEAAQRTEKSPGPPLAAEQVAIKPLWTRNGTPKFVLLVCGALLFLAVLTGWRLLRPHPVRESIQLTPLPLTAATGVEDSPSFSPDGNQVAYSWSRSENPLGNDPHIYVKSIGSGKPLQLTAGVGSDRLPVWSPDGRMIAFVRFLDQAAGIYAIPPMGGAERKIAEGFFGPMSWSPDGRFLATSEDSSPGLDSSSLYLLNVENGKNLRLTTPPDAKRLDQDPAFSPDGHSLLFKRCDSGYQCQLYLLDLAAYQPVGGPRLLRDAGGFLGGAAWTADGKEVVYSLSDDGTITYHLMKLRIEMGAQPQRLVFAGDRAAAPAIAGRGNRLAYSQALFDIDIWQIEPGKPPRSFASSTRQDYNPQYSPDGKRVVFSSDRSGLMQIWVCDQDGGNTVQLTRFDTGHSGTPRWSPDGRSIAFDRQLKEGWRIFLMASDGGQVRRLTPGERDNGDEYIPSWSRDGKWIYYSSNRTGPNEVWKAPARGGNGTQVTNRGGYVAFESHDGQSIYYTKNVMTGMSGVWVLPLGGGEERLVVKSILNRSFAVMEDGLYYFIPNKPDDTTSLQFHSFDTGKNAEIAPIKYAPANGMSVSPDRRTILFSVAVRSGGNVMVVDNFR